MEHITILAALLSVSGELVLNLALAPSWVHIHHWIYAFYLQQLSIYTHDGASAKFSTNSHETDYGD